ncbi:hypothetical protein AeRB84_021033 [Aphanomyces euteiches]|nr:hypothetical protein AeRB84_021033 [Aphanomyces euteiches]
MSSKEGELLEAVKRGDLQSVHVLLLVGGVNVDCKDKDANTPLHWAARCGYLDILTELLAYNSSADLTNKVGSSPLHEASSNGHINIVEKLLSGGVFVDSVDKFGDLSLHAAAFWGHSDVAKKLLDHGANANLKNKNGYISELNEWETQYNRGLEHYECQVSLGNISRDVELDANFEVCQSQIIALFKTLLASENLSEAICMVNIKSLRLCIDDIQYDPNEENSIIRTGVFGPVFKGKYHGQEVAVEQVDEVANIQLADAQEIMIQNLNTWKDISKKPCILAFAGVCSKAETHILVTECHETNIRHFIKDWPDMLLPIVYQFAKGLHFLHQANIIHGEIRADNVLITTQKTVAITNVGVSRTIGSVKFNWMSPEQFFGSQNLTTKSDVWSFGMTLWEIVSDDIPFFVCSEDEFRDDIFTSNDDRPEKPEEFNPLLEPLPSASEIVKDLEQNYNVQDLSSEEEGCFVDESLIDSQGVQADASTKTCTSLEQLTQLISEDKTKEWPLFKNYVLLPDEVESRNSNIFRCRCELDQNKQFVVKLSKDRHEIDVLNSLVGIEGAVDYIVRIVDWCEWTGANYTCFALIMERGEENGSDCIWLLRKDALATYRFINQLVIAVKFLHGQGWIHANIELDNITDFGHEMSYRLMGFDQARKIGEKLQQCSLTKFRPPEMAAYLMGDVSDLEASESFDVWCVAVIILQIFLTDNEFQESSGLDYHQVQQRIASPDFNFNLSLKASDLDGQQKDILARCLHRDPTQRGTLDDIFCLLSGSGPRSLGFVPSCDANLMKMSSSEAENTVLKYSITSATEIILEVLDNTNTLPEISGAAREIFAHSPRVQVHKEHVLATALMVERILNYILHKRSLDEDPALLPVLKEIENFWRNTLVTTGIWKFQPSDTQDKERVQAIRDDIIRLQLRLRQSVDHLPINLNIEVKGTIEDFRKDIGNTMEKIVNLAKYLESISKNPEEQQTRDALVELMIQMQRGFDHYELQVALGNIPRMLEFESNVGLCQQQIDFTLNTLKQARKVPESLNRNLIQKWMISSDHVEYDEKSALGSGGFATVFKGVYNGQMVAVKKFHHIHVTDPTDLEPVVAKEIKAWKDISHLPYILTLVGFCAKNMTPILVSELCIAKTNIRRYVRDWPEKLLPLVYQFACGLASIHRANIIHRDLKGDNVLITCEKKVAIADFGLSRAVTSMENATANNGSGWTGTLNWMSPEQYFTPRQVTMKSDVWSFGMTLWEILCNATPFRRSSDHEFEEILRSDSDRPEKPQDLDPNLEPLWILISMCWRLDPQARPTADDIVEFLESNYNSSLKEIGHP